MDLFYCGREDNHCSQMFGFGGRRQCLSCHHMWSGLLAPPQIGVEHGMEQGCETWYDIVYFPLNIRLWKPGPGRGLWKRRNDHTLGHSRHNPVDLVHFRLLGFTKELEVPWHADTRNGVRGEDDDCTRLFAECPGGRAIRFRMGGHVISDGDGCVYNWLSVKFIPCMHFQFNPESCRFTRDRSPEVSSDG